MGLDKENTFGCLTDYLFRPTIGSRRFINAYRDLFQMESVLSIGMQVGFVLSLEDIPQRHAHIYIL